MQYVCGNSLREYIAAKGKIEPLEVVRIGQQIAQGLAAAHAQGVIHRDIKPGNIMLHEGATLAQLSDFGLARVTMDNADLSSQDQCVGTPSYMSPEMLRGQRIDARSDLFGLGYVFIQMLMGYSPFRGRTQAEVILKILDSTPKDLHELNADVPPVLSAVVRRLLEKDPDRRYQSAAEVAEVLSRLQRQLNLAHSDEFESVMAGVMPARERTLRRRLWIAMPIALILGAFFTRDRWVPPSLPGISSSNENLNREQVEKFKEITVGLGPNADYATIAEAVFHADVDATITVEGGGSYTESVVISGQEYNGLRLIASGPTTWSCEPIDEPCALTIKDVENVEVRGFEFEVEAIKGRAISISNDARSIGLMDSFRSESLPAGKTTSRVCNNLILGGERVQGGDDQWTVVADAFEFGANWWERDSTTRPLSELHRRIATQHDQLEVPERDNKNAENFLLPTIHSPLLTSGIGGYFPHYIGANGRR